MKLKCGLAVIALIAFAGVSAAQEHEHGAPARLGTVHFANSCNKAAQAPFERAVALLHSFQFRDAVEAFQQTLKADPGCGVAWWGIALSRWSNPMAQGQRTPEQLQQGLSDAEQGTKAGARTARERDYIAAAGALYRDYDKVAQRDRQLAYVAAMKKLGADYPKDNEAAIFYALALVAAADPADKTYANQREAGSILEPLFRKEPDHPGLAHYIIHAYDVPPLASRALPAARAYSKIAPDAPHALHMPSHTFTRVGDWQASIDSNIEAAASARRHAQAGEELHSMDYRMYAYLQTGQDGAAQQLLASLQAMREAYEHQAANGAAPPLAGAYALAAIPARWVLERRAWDEAVKLEVYPSRFPQADATTHFVRALGAAHVEDAAGARAEIDALDQLQQTLANQHEAYWAEQVGIQHDAAAAWVIWAEGRKDDAIRKMRAVAEREDRTEKDAVTPGPIAPARELLGEMLLERDDAKAALPEFEATLKREPHRFHAVYGAATSARRASDDAKSRRYYRELLDVCARADKPGRPELAEARKALASGLIH